MTAVDAVKRVSWAELFYDLVFVFAVMQVAIILADDVSVAGMLRAWVLFTPFWWAWVGTGILSNFTDLDRVKDRLRLFGIGLFTFLMTVAAPSAFGVHSVFFAAMFVVLRLLLLWWSVDRFGRIGLTPFSTSAVVTGPLLLATSLLAPETRLVAWTLLMVAELSTTWVLRDRLKDLRVDAAHLPERFGLVVMIALGESLVSTGGAVSHGFGGIEALSLAACFALTCGLWWLYFHRSYDALVQLLRSERNQSRVIRDLLAYGHYGLICAIVAIAVGMKFVVKHPGDRPQQTVDWLLCLGTALFLVVFIWTRWWVFRLLAAVRVPAVGLCVAVGLVGPLMPAAALAALLAALLIIVALVETGYVRRARARQQT
ncbi:low temperature requirement protein A [Kutzneria chonburiensis]|uniref:Low temperature requirement protein A n=1 Tax=Kutzneria chonburiensis TaxID=1483604 RepID=A0ABV6MX25_9PSEU|nr:low temperature requirement protein A [Kutzneria chonburiensis]